MSDIIKHLALVFVLTGAITTSFGMTPYNVYWMNLGSFFYLVWAIRVKDINLIFVNAALLFIYLCGTYYNLR